MDTGRVRVSAERLHMTPSFALPGFGTGKVVGQVGAVGIAIATD